MGQSNRWLILAIVSSALFLIVIDMTVLYTALPTLTRELNVSASDKLWIVNIYPLVVAGLLPGFGALGDRFGHKQTFLVGLIVFGLASLWAAYSDGAASLIGARVMLAMGAALMMPATLSLIRLTFTDVQERSFAIGIWAAVASGGAALGPVIGGFLLEYFWWGSVFLINVPVALVALVAGSVLLKNRPGNPNLQWDLVGSVQIMVGLIGVTFAIKEIAKIDPSPVNAAVAMVIGTTAIVVFVRRQRRRASAPLIDFSLFSNPVFSGGVLAAMIASASMIGFELVYSQRLQLVQGFSPLEAGLRILPIPLSAFIAGPIAGLLLVRVGTKLLLWLPLAVIAVALIAFLITRDMAPVYWITSLVLLGFGVGTAITAASSAIMLSSPKKSAGMAASIEEVSYELGGSLGIAVLGSVMAAFYTQNLLLPDGVTTPDSVRQGLDQALLYAGQLEGTERALIASLARAAFDQSFSAVVAITAALLAAAALVQLLIVLRRAPDLPLAGDGDH